MLTKDEFEARFEANYRIEGFGLGMKIHSPCPFCGAPDFHVYMFATMMSVMARETVCKECNRGFRAAIKVDANGIDCRPYQTRGDDPPSYIPIARGKRGSRDVE